MMIWGRKRTVSACVTFVSLLRLPQVDLGDGFEVDVPEADASVSTSGGEAFLTGIHAEDPSLHREMGNIQQTST